MELFSLVLELQEQGAPLQRQEFHRETVEKLDFSELDCHESSFTSSRFIDCDFSGTSFYGCRFENCQFSGCRFPVSYWKNTSLCFCKADGADLRRARFKNCTLVSSLLRYANCADSVWDKTSITSCSFTESSMASAAIRSCCLQQVDFSGAVFFRAELKGLNLSSCTIDRITLSENCAELRGTKIDASQAALVARILGIEVLNNY